MPETPPNRPPNGFWREEIAFLLDWRGQVRWGKYCELCAVHLAALQIVPDEERDELLTAAEAHMIESHHLGETRVIDQERARVLEERDQRRYRAAGRVA